jgi:hypothetical protein
MAHFTLSYLKDGSDPQRARLRLLSSTLRRFLDPGSRAIVLEIADGVPMVLSQLAVSVSRAVHLFPSLYLECSRQVQSDGSPEKVLSCQCLFDLHNPFIRLDRQ